VLPGANLATLAEIPAVPGDPRDTRLPKAVRGWGQPRGPAQPPRSPRAPQRLLGGAEQMCGFSSPPPKEHPRLFSHTQVKLRSRDAEPWKFGWGSVSGLSLSALLWQAGISVGTFGSSPPRGDPRAAKPPTLRPQLRC